MCHFSHWQYGTPVGSIMAGSGSVQAASCKLSSICNTCIAFHIGIGGTPVGSILAGSGHVQAAGWDLSTINTGNACYAFHICRGSTPAGAIRQVVVMSR
jgi:hypothetical protein